MVKKAASEKQSFSLKSPVVAVLGHVDHGKTTLLDTIRKSRIASGESGAITQHIGAYQVPVEGKKITFIDTPGHEAFMNLRTRGAKVADIALLVIDAVESVKPQTIESIKLIKQAGIPMIVAINKIDLPTAQPKKVTKDLLRYDVIVEEHGGNIATVPISAKTGKGVTDLLSTIILVAELKKLTTIPYAPFEGVVIESKKDKTRGNVATVLVQKGNLLRGDKIFTNQESFKIRALFNDRGTTVTEATPGMPVEVLGFPSLPSVGSIIATGSGVASPDAIIPVSGRNTTRGESVLSILLKADTQGSLEAISAGLPAGVLVVSAELGDISEGDVAYAKIAGLVIIGFQVGFTLRVKKLAEDEGVRIRTYTVIYQLFEEIAEVIEILKRGPQKKIIGEAKILQEFAATGGKVAGCQVVEGRIAKGDKVVIIRNGEEIGNARIKSVRQQKEEVTKVEKGKICGVQFAGDVDFRIGDMIQSYTVYEL
ncbi:GTP-binding protein [Candidatus Roizmanbacteria bacterium]|nr:GTP-binding protein [Candidatus Roizmanbacteria bacterium]